MTDKTSMELKAGDVVRIKSRGPSMTIDELVSTSAGCVWFEGSVLHKGRFALETLEKVTP